jgi:hypothetical protein
MGIGMNRENLPRENMRSQAPAGKNLCVTGRICTMFPEAPQQFFESLRSPPREIETPRIPRIVSLQVQKVLRLQKRLHFISGSAAIYRSAAHKEDRSLIAKFSRILLSRRALSSR